MTKKIISVLIMIFVSLTLTSCGEEKNTEETINNGTIDNEVVDEKMIEETVEPLLENE